MADIVPLDQPVLILYDFKAGLTAVQSHHRLQRAFGQKTISMATVSRWYHKFEKGDFNLHIKPSRKRSNVPRSKLLKALRENPAMDEDQIASTLNLTDNAVRKVLQDANVVKLDGKWIETVQLSP